MDRDDPNTRSPDDHNFEDEITQGEMHKPEGVLTPEEEAAEWTEPPVDDFTDAGQDYVEDPAELSETESTYRADDGGEGPIEEDFTAEEPLPEEGMHAEGDDDLSSARQQAEEYLPRGMQDKKSGIMKYLPYAATGVVLVVLGILGYQHVQSFIAGQGTDMTPPPLQTAHEDVPPPAPSAAAKKVMEENGSTEPPSQVATGNPPPLPPVPAGSLQPPAHTPPAPPVTEVKRGPDYILTPGTEAMPPAMPSKAAAVPLPAAPVAPAPAPASAEITAANEALKRQVASLTQQLDEMKKNQERINSQMNALNAASSTPPAAPAVDEGLKNSVQSMESKIAQLEEKFNTTANAPPPVSAPSVTPTASDEKPPVPEKKKASTKTASKKTEEKTESAGTTDRPVKKSSSKNASRHHGKGSTDYMAAHLQHQENARMYGGGVSPVPGMLAPAPVPQPNNVWQQPDSGAMMAPVPVMTPPPVMVDPSGGWVLRSAQPGAAWVSQGMSADLRRVVPGDQVPGLGTIVSVRMVAGRWVVEGTQGSVR